MGSGGGSDQHFCLRWNNFHSNIATSFEQLRDHEDFVDVTLACEGRTIKAHKVVLSACSPYFRNLLKQNPCQHPIIILRDVAFVDVSALLSFVYQGEVYVSQERLTAFLHTAELLHIKGLTEQQHHHTTASTTHTGPITGTNINSSSCGGSNNSNLGSGIAVSLLAPHSGGTTVPLTHLIAAAPQPPHQQTEQSPHPAARGVPRSPSPTRPHSSPSPPLLPPPYIPPPSSHHISPPPKKRRHQQQQSSLTSQCASSIASPLSSSSSSTTTDPHPLSPPHPSDNPPPPIPALATPKIEVGTSLLSGPGSSCLLGGSTLAAALTAPRGDTPLSAASVSAVSAPPPLLLPVEVKQEAVESPLLLDDGGSSSSSVGSNLMSEQQAVNLVLETNTGSPSPSCSILRQRIQGYQGSPDAPPPPNYPPPSRGVDDDGGGSDGGEGKEGLTPPSAVAIIRRQHMIGLAAAAAAAGVYNSGGGGGGGATASLSGGDAGQPTQSPQGSGGLLLPPSTTITPTTNPLKAFSSLMGGSPTPPLTNTSTCITTTPGGGLKVGGGGGGGGRPRYAGPRNCPHCGERYSTIAALKYHVGLVHSVSDQVPCFYCPNWFDIRTDLKKHLELAHNEHS